MKWIIAPFLYILVLPFVAYTIEGWRIVLTQIDAMQPFRDAWSLLHEITREVVWHQDFKLTALGYLMILSLLIGVIEGVRYLRKNKEIEGKE